MIADDRPIRAALALAVTLGCLALLFAQRLQTRESGARRIGYDPTNLPDGTHVEEVTPGEPADRGHPLEQPVEGFRHRIGEPTAAAIELAVAEPGS